MFLAPAADSAVAYKGHEGKGKGKGERRRAEGTVGKKVRMGEGGGEGGETEEDVTLIVRSVQCTCSVQGVLCAVC